MNNAATVGWMAWELINAELDVDIREKNIKGLKKIPLGSYVENLINVR